MRTSAIIFTFLAACLTAGCLRPGVSKPDAADVVALVNGDPITTKALRREIALRSKKDPSFKATPRSICEQLDVLINRRLLIQEAQSRKITENERFTLTIQTFWEQTLVRLLMDSLYEEFRPAATVTDAEVREFYSKLDEKATFQVLASENEEAVTATEKTAQSGGTVAWQRTIGPVRYGDIRSEALEKAFEMTPGQVKVFRQGSLTTLVKLVSKETDEPPSLETIRPNIETSIKERKQRRAFENWFSEKRRTANVKLSLERLKETV